MLFNPDDLVLSHLNRANLARRRFDQPPRFLICLIRTCALWLRKNDRADKQNKHPD